MFDYVVVVFWPFFYVNTVDCGNVDRHTVHAGTLDGLAGTRRYMSIVNNIFFAFKTYLSVRVPPDSSILACVGCASEAVDDGGGAR